MNWMKRLVVWAAVFSLALSSAGLWAARAQDVPASDMLFGVTWQDQYGQSYSAQAVPIPYEGYETSFWLMLPAEAMGSALYLSITDVYGQYTSFEPLNGSPIIDVVDNGVNFIAPILITAIAGNSERVVQYSLYLSQSELPPQPGSVIMDVQVPVYYRSADGRDVASPMSYSCAYGQTTTIYCKPSDLQDGYTLLGDDTATVTVNASGANPAEVVFYYEAAARADAQVSVHYRDASSGQPIATSQTVTCAFGQNTPVYANPADLMAGYSISGDSVQDVYVDQSGANPSEVIFLYTYEKPHTSAQVTVYYRDAYGATVASPQTVECAYGQQTAVWAQPEDLQPNYTLTGDSVQYVTVDGGGAHPSEIVFVYAYSAPVADVTVTIRHVDEFGAAVASPQTQVCAYGQTTAVYANPTDLKAGYNLLSNGVQDVTVDEGGAHPAEIVFVYEIAVTQPPDMAPTPYIPAIAVIQIVYQTEDGEVLFKTDQAVTEDAVNQVYADEGRVSGYELIGVNPQSVTVFHDGSTEPSVIVFTFRKTAGGGTPSPALPGYVNVYYQTENGQNVATSTVAECYEGNNMVLAAPHDLKNGYELIGDNYQYVAMAKDGTLTPGAITFVYRMPDAPTAPPAAAPTAYATAAPVAPGEVIDKWGMVTGKGVNMRSRADTSGTRLDQFSAGARLFIYESVRNSAGEIWYRIRANGMDGYMMAEYVDVFTQAISDEYQASLFTPMPTRLPATPAPAAPTQTPVPPAQPTAMLPTQLPSIYTGYALTLTDTALYPATKESGEALIALREDTLIQILDQAYVSGVCWHRALELSSGVTGYIRDVYVRTITDGEAAEYLKRFTPTPTAPPATPTPSPTLAPTAVPDGTAIDRWGVANAIVNFRKEASTDAKRHGKLEVNARVFVYSATTVSGTRWYYARVNGVDGYVVAEYVDLMSPQDSAVYQASLPTPMFTSTPMPTVTPTPSPTPTPTLVPPPTSTPTPAPYMGYAITNSRCELRYGGSATDTSVITVLEPLTLVWVNSQTFSGGACWNAVQVLAGPNQNVTGYIHNDALQPISETDAQHYYQFSATPTPSPIPDQYSGYARTLGGGVPMRTAADSNANILSVLSIGSVVQVISQQYVDGQTWHLALMNQQWGYILDSQLAMLSDREVSDYIASLSTPAPTIFATPTLAPVTSQSLSSYGYVTSNKVNLRKAPEGTSIRLLNKYAFALVLGSEESGGYTWYRVQQSGTEGYVRSDYFHLLTLGEMEEFLTSPEYKSAEDTQTTTTTITSLEDYNTTVWTNPSLAKASYEPFNPFGTPTPPPAVTATPTVSPSPTVFSTASVHYEVVETTTSQPPYTLIVAGVLAVLAAGGIYAYTLVRANRRRQAERARQRAREVRRAPGGQPVARNARASGSPAYAPDYTRPPVENSPGTYATPVQGTYAAKPQPRDTSVYAAPAVMRAQGADNMNGTRVYPAAQNAQDMNGTRVYPAQNAPAQNAPAQNAPAQPRRRRSDNSVPADFPNSSEDANK